MEDAHLADTSLPGGLAIFAVFDGHGGIEIADFCARNMVNVLTSLPKFEQKYYDGALKECFMQLDELIKSPQGQQDIKNNCPGSNKFQFQHVGCTATCVLVTKDKIYCANAGDSRSVLQKGDKIVALSRDHKPELESESARIIAAGGEVRNGRVNGGLATSRAIGDHHWKT